MMSRNYSFANQKAQQPQNSYTDQRIIQIMKKYEQPHRNTPNYNQHNHHQHNNPSHTKPSHNHSPYRTYLQAPPNDRMPLQETPLNIHRNDEMLHPSRRDWKEGSYKRHRQNVQIDKYTPPKNSQKYNEDPYRGKYQEQSFRGGYQYKHNFQNQKSYKSPSPYGQNQRTTYKKTRVVQDELKYQPNSHYDQQHSYAESSSFHEAKRAPCQEPNKINLCKFEVSGKRDTRDEREEFTPVRKHYQRDICKTTNDDRYSREKEVSLSIHKTFDNVDCDGRISNIEKINQRIKKILDTGSGVHQEYHPQPEPKDRDKLTTNAGTKLNNYGGIGDRISLNLNIDLEKEGNCQKDRLQKKEKMDKENTQKELRSKSCIYKAKPQESDIDHKYNRIKEKIADFNNKIALHDQEKKKINTQLTPKRQNSCWPKDTGNSYTKSVQRYSKTESRSNLQLSSNYSKSKHRLPQVEMVESHRSSELNLQEMEIVVPDKLTEPRRAEHKQIIIEDPQPKSSFESNQIIQSQFYSGMDDYSHDYPIIQHTTAEQDPLNNESKRFIKLLAEQVRLDEQFRLTKNWFVNSDINNQYEVLQSILGERWREMTLEEVKAEFSVNFQEDDPFYSYRSDHFVLEDLVTNYILCNKNWKEKIEHSWRVQELRGDGLVGRLDMDGKGHVSIEDLVRIINMQEGTFFRNRDLYLSFQRILRRQASHSQMIGVAAFLSFLGNK